MASSARSRVTPSPLQLNGRRLILVAEGSNRVGLGHLMRMLALGQAWSDEGGQVEGLLGEAPDALVDRYRREGFLVRRIGAGAKRGRVDGLRALLRDDAAAVAAIDRPNLTLADLEALDEGARRTLVVDDMGLLTKYPVALVLNQNAHAARAAYPAVNDDQLLLGLKYVLLRREFQGPIPGRSIRARAKRLLVTFGGGDPTGLTARTVEALGLGAQGGLVGLRVRVIIGVANEAADRITALVEQSPLTVTVERGLENMAEVMTWADLAITAGGSTVWELARTGCPALVVSTVPGEVSLASGLDRMDLFDRLGLEDRLDAGRLVAAVAERVSDRPWRTLMARRGQSLVDGQGARRVVEALAALNAR